MPYKRTGNPPGRPRKNKSQPDAEKPVLQKRFRKAFRAAYGNPADALYSPPRLGARRKREVGKRPVLHPNVIAGLANG